MDEKGITLRCLFLSFNLVGQSSDLGSWNILNIKYNFERNRILLAFNYKPSKNPTFQIGYFYQFDYRINDEIGRDFLQIGFLSRFSEISLGQKK